MIGRRLFVRNVFAALAMAPAARAFAGTARIETAPTVYDATFKATLPKGAVLRIVARSGQPAVEGGAYAWHAAPDGGACFKTGNGWIYVSNSEVGDSGGGVGALRFDASGNIADSYPILKGTSTNCAGGRTPWGTWLSCEENGDAGQVYECDPTGEKPAQVRPGLGSFNHEAAAFDPKTGIVYLTEDRPDGCLYRFVPATAGDLSAGRLEVAVVDGPRLAWAPVPDPSAARGPTRTQVPGVQRFAGSEGIIYSDGKVYFTTKHDNRVWRLTLATREIAAVYDIATSANPILKGVDNIEVTPTGELLVAEDGGDMQIVALTRSYKPVALVTLHGQDKSEITGPAFSPDGRRLYFSSQRGIQGTSEHGLTYELDLGAAGIFR
ncbi:MAG: PhoX family protein [Rhodospirillaceae bacterium]|nr:PhoX family protein [Rhodospirillaceae bacterium]